MKKFWIVALALSSTFTLASSKQDSIESLKARAEQANPKDQVDLCTHIAERQLDTLDKAYNEGNIMQARAALADVQGYGVKAAEMSRQTGKHMKQTEIALRKMAGRLEAIRKTLDVDDRPPVGEAVQKLEAARSELLTTMFKK
jgi:hypothetical protein